jgi:glycosyltransferase involved in cell wall biosynthesis
MNLSLCMIVKNEAMHIERCLDSVRSMVDEMIVLDTGSTDATVQLAKASGAEVYHFDWIDDFSAARNESLKYAKGDWILVLDADEVLVDSCLSTLRPLMSQADVLVINLVRQEVGATQSPYSMVSRLFRNHDDIQFTRPYHAMIDESVMQLRQKESHWRVIDFPDIAMLHYGYEPDAIANRDKFQKAQRLMERFLVTHPGEPYVCNKLGALYVEADKVNYGIELLERGLKASQIEPSVLYELHYHLGIAYGKAQNFQQSEYHYRSATQQLIVPRLKLGAYNNLGSVLQAKGDLPGARVAYELALKAEPNFAMGHCHLGMVFKAMGQLTEAIAHYQTAIRLNPDYAEAYQNLAVVLLKIGKVPDSLENFKRAIALHDQHNPPEAERLRKGLKEMGF